jgi:hypothetical protein
MVSFDVIILFVASERVFIVVSVYSFIDAVRKLLAKPSYIIKIYSTCKRCVNLCLTKHRAIKTYLFLN